MKGIVIKSTGNRCIVKIQTGETVECMVKGLFRISGSKNTNPVAVGDVVVLEDINRGIGVVGSIEQRKNYIIRKSTNLSKQTHIIAANIDQAMLLVTLVLPKTLPVFIDRFLATAEAYSIPAILVFNKVDIYQQETLNELNALKAVYEKIGYQCIETSAKEKINITAVKNSLKNKTTLLSGNSGVGKSSLINAIEPALNLSVKELSVAHLKGKHTTTFAEMHPLSFGGNIIDTPGIKSFGVVDFVKEEVAGFFPEIFAIGKNCKFSNCKHVNEPHCAVLQSVENGVIAFSRYNSYINILFSEEVEPGYKK
jgi:ribosome biogenesis GTPase / thiamine phosphate phosphatase